MSAGVTGRIFTESPVVCQAADSSSPSRLLPPHTQAGASVSLPSGRPGAGILPALAVWFLILVTSCVVWALAPLVLWLL